MNRTKTMTIVAIVVGLVTLGIGFAAFSQSLTISSSAAVNPTNTFKVVFSSTPSGTNPTTTAVEPTKNPTSITANNATIDNTGAIPKLSNLGVTFTEPGQSATYTFYASNTGEYDAYLNNVIYANAIGAESFKVCTPGLGVADSLVQEACKSISVEVKVGDEQAVSTTANYSNHVLAKAGYEPVVVTIKYVSGGSRADGAFTVSFGDISLEYSTLGSANINGGSTSTNTYAIGDEVKLLGQVTYDGTSYDAKTYTITGTDSDSGNFIYTTKNYSEWNVVKQTDTTITLLSKYPLGSVFDSSGNYYGFVYDSINICTACTISYSTPDKIYTYGTTTATIPTSDDLSEIVSISGNTYTFINQYEGFNTGMYKNMIASPAISILGYKTMPMAVTINGVDKMLYEYDTAGYISDTSVDDTTGNYGGSTFSVNYLYRPAITLSKSEIPDQAQFN